MQHQQPISHRTGALYGLGAYAIWGVLPVYMALLRPATGMEIVAHRVVWSVLLLTVALALLGRFGRMTAVFRAPRLLAMLATSALLIGGNWLIYIYSVLNGHVLAASLGYFINPLVSVAMGVTLLGERLRPLQGGAVALAAVGVVILAAGGGAGLALSLGLAVSFASYGLVRKLAPVPPLEGLAVETVLLGPLALAYLVWLAQAGSGTFGGDLRHDLLLATSGAVTAAPLLLFAAAARRLPLATLGILQYVAPTLQFLLAVLVFDEPLTPLHLVTFGCIWSALALYMADGVRHARRPMLPE